MTDAVKLTDLESSDLQRRMPRRGGKLRKTGNQAALDSRSAVEFKSGQPGRLDRVHRSLSAVTPENQPRTARLLASSTRKAAQTVIEEAGRVTPEAVKHHARGIVRESADLLCHLVALWLRFGINPDEVRT
jgi:phosphoribosyl-ATP pyrophosphohydrolase